MRFSVSIVLSFFWLFFMSSLSASDNEEWRSDGMVTATSCNDLSYQDAARFVNDYYRPALGYLPTATDVEQQFFEVYSIASAVTLRSQLCLAEALDLNELSNDLRKEVALIEGGTSFGKNEVEKQREMSSNADFQIRTATEQIDELAPEQKKTFTMGLATYLIGTYATSEMIKIVDDVAVKAADDAKNTSEGLLGLAKNPKQALGGFLGRKRNVSVSNPVKVVTFFAELLPGVKDQIVRLVETGKSLMEFSNEQGVELPEDATSNLSSFMVWE